MEIYPIDKNDIETLRIWKNSYKNSFFLQHDISIDQQIKWFKKYLNDQNNHMYIVVANNTKIGCIGARLETESTCWDIYNVINADPFSRGKGYMKSALLKVIKIIRSKQDLPVQAKVLKTNPAFEWYKRIGFHVSEDRLNYSILTFNG